MGPKIVFWNHVWRVQSLFFGPMSAALGSHICFPDHFLDTCLELMGPKHVSQYGPGSHGAHVGRYGPGPHEAHGVHVSENILRNLNKINYFKYKTIYPGRKLKV